LYSVSSPLIQRVDMSAFSAREQINGTTNRDGTPTGQNLAFQRWIMELPCLDAHHIQRVRNCIHRGSRST
jgi:hypothetical protein